MHKDFSRNDDYINNINGRFSPAVFNVRNYEFRFTTRIGKRFD